MLTPTDHLCILHGSQRVFRIYFSGRNKSLIDHRRVLLGNCKESRSHSARFLLRPLTGRQLLHYDVASFLGITMNLLVFVTVFCCLFVAVFTQKSKGSPEVMSPSIYDGDASHDSLNKISTQLLSVLAEIEEMQDGNQQFKMAEKRRNKFEFIRFGVTGQIERQVYRDTAEGGRKHAMTHYATRWRILVA
ncbi:unnamed protein product [Caenorhabditis auriculariae]|uniref:Uncharacterized protein n=1 Tax=Caenorhabditis auriculariae TaxID=2777116 RepID=A0A8S1GQ42_9PELO|nr:unnamed protein product [Caenorhabditis auriculariae]